jgi:hypothetical protein
MEQAGISSEAVKAKTGKTWEEWLKVLDKEKANKMPHKEIAQLLSDKYEISPWWSQMVTVGYERARGLREVHQTSQGFVAGVSRTINADQKTIWAMIYGDRKSWLKGKFEDFSSTPPKSLRLSHSDGSRVELALMSKGPQKTTITASHSKLKDANEVAAKKEFWQDALGKLKKLLKA